jgi:hypothetical protein
MLIRMSAVLMAVLVLGCASAVASPPNHVESFSGEVLIDTKGSAVVILLDTNREGRDGVVDQWFTLWSADPPAISEHLTNGQISFSGGFLRVVSPEQRVIYEFAVAGYGRPANIPAGFRAMRVEGHGLTHNSGETTVRIPSIRRGSITTFDCVGCDIVYPCDGCTEAGGSSPTCDSGGQGATSCSVSSGSRSCTITCSAGYYSCCNTTATSVSCKCIAG